MNHYFNLAHAVVVSMIDVPALVLTFEYDYFVAVRGDPDLN